MKNPQDSAAMKPVVFCGGQPGTCGTVCNLESVYCRNIRIHSSILYPVRNLLNTTFSFLMISGKKTSRKRA